ncbi:MAG: hypothetical protein WBX25_00255 [Rhodomicrobium sp.]
MIAFKQLATGPHRSPDPWLDVTDRFIFRRLAADARKVNLAQNTDTEAPKPDAKHAAQLLQAMGFDLGAVHAETEQQKLAILNDLDQRDQDWLHEAARSAAEWVTADYTDWCKNC